MQIQLRETDDVVIADLSGRLVSGVGDRVLRETLDSLLGQGRDKILLNLSEVSTIDSSGIGELVAGLRLAQRLGASMKILSLGERVERTLRLGQLLPLFDIHKDEVEALASFAEDSESQAG